MVSIIDQVRGLGSRLRYVKGRRVVVDRKSASAGVRSLGTFTFEHCGPECDSSLYKVEVRSTVIRIRETNDVATEHEEIVVVATRRVETKTTGRRMQGVCVLLPVAPA